MRLYRPVLYLMSGVMVVFTACRVSPETPSSSLPGSTLQYDVSYSEGLPLSGGKPADGNSLRFEDSLGIAATLFAMSQCSGNALEPVASRAQMIAVFPASTAVTAVPGLLRRATVGVIQDEAQFREQMAASGPVVPLPVERLCGILPNGVGVSFRILERPVFDSGAIRMLEIQVRRRFPQEQERRKQPATGISLEISLVATGNQEEIALLDADSVASSGGKQGPSPPTVAGMFTTETILLTPQELQEQDRLAVVLPSPFDVEGVAAFAALIEVTPPPRKGTDEAIAYAALQQQCRDYLLGTARWEGQRFDAGRRGLEDAIRLLQSPTHKQRALLHLAQETRTPLIEDVALSATDVVVDHLAYAITNACASGPPFETNVLGWRLEKTTCQFLADLMSADQTPPDLEAILIRHTGEVGRHPSVLKEMVSHATSIEDLRQRLLLENFIYLEDISPAARARAFEWLAARGRAPEGYDPIASPKERRGVLDQVVQEQQ